MLGKFTADLMWQNCRYFCIKHLHITNENLRPIAIWLDNYEVSSTYEICCHHRLLLRAVVVPFTARKVRVHLDHQQKWTPSDRTECPPVEGTAFSPNQEHWQASGWPARTTHDNSILRYYWRWTRNTNKPKHAFTQQVQSWNPEGHLSFHFDQKMDRMRNHHRRHSPVLTCNIPNEQDSILGKRPLKLSQDQLYLYCTLQSSYVHVYQ